jgi:hypothetical protein
MPLARFQFHKRGQHRFSTTRELYVAGISVNSGLSVRALLGFDASVQESFSPALLSIRLSSRNIMAATLRVAGVCPEWQSAVEIKWALVRVDANLTDAHVVESVENR